MPKIFMASLGCAKNLVDAEIMLGETLDQDFELVLNPDDADVVLINTCGFIEEARAEAKSVIGEYLDLKKRTGGRLKVVATGCWAERSPDELVREFPDLDAVWGLSIPSSLREAIAALDRAGGVAGIGKRPAPRDGARLLSTPPSYAYLRLSDGCDNRCRYCAIPLIRGGLVSRAPGAILEEAKALEGQGVKELILISQDTTAYGRDLGAAGIGLAALLERLLETVSLPRLRLLYAHPAHLDEQTSALLLAHPRLCRYVDLPIQHASDRVLAGMGRGYGRDRIRELLDRFAGGGMILRTTLLLGFPGEREEDFLQALDLVREGKFHHLGAFAYSPEPGTAAFDLAERVPAEEASRRRDAILEAQSRVAFSWLDSRIGGTESILVDSCPGPGVLAGRSAAEAPDADGTIFLPGSDSRPGDMVEACISAREGYDLIATPVGQGEGRRRLHGKRGRRRPARP